MRVLHVIDHLGLGGAPLFVKTLVHRLAEDRDLEPTVCALRPHPTSVSLDVPVITLGYQRFDATAFRGIRRVCRSQAIDVVHAHLEKSIISTLIAGPGCGCPIVVHEHGGVLRSGSGGLYRTALRCFGDRASWVIANSEATRRALMNAGPFSPGTIGTVPSFIDVQRFSPTDREKMLMRRLFAIDPHETVLGFVGRLQRCKGADRVIRAAAVLRRRGINCRVLIVGDGRERGFLERCAAGLGIAEAVIFAGATENPEEPMAAFDIAMVPSRREGFSRVVVELMAMGVPVVAVSVGALPELVHHRQTGILVDDPSPEYLAAGVQLLLENEDLREKVRRNAVHQSRRFDGAAEVAKMRTLYHRLATRDKTG